MLLAADALLPQTNSGIISGDPLEDMMYMGMPVHDSEGVPHNILGQSEVLNLASHSKHRPQPKEETAPDLWFQQENESETEWIYVQLRGLWNGCISSALPFSPGLRGRLTNRPRRLQSAHSHANVHHALARPDLRRKTSPSYTLDL